MEQNPIPSPLEQLKQLSEESAQTWQRVINIMKQATYELVELTEEEKMLLDESFWSVHPGILERAERMQPGITEQVLLRSEEISHAQREADEEEFQRVTLPRVKRAARLRGALGISLRQNRR